jgi:glycosyltransferase involved in cell wall biosynthesis
MKRILKIGFDAKRAFLNSSGLGNYSRNTLNALHQFFPGNDYILFTPEIKEDLFENYNHFKIVSPQNLVVKKLKSLWRSFFLVGLIKRYDVDLYHGLSNELPKGINKSGIPSVVTIHDVVFMRYPEFYQPIDRKIYFKKVKHACKSASKVIAISRQTQTDIETFFKVPPEKIELIYQPIAPVFFEKQNREKIRKKYNLPEKFLLAVGTLEPRKNQLAVLKAIHSANIHLPLVFVGRPTSYSAKLNRFIAENNMEGQVIFLSNLPEKDLAGFYQSALVSLYVSVFEGFGLPVIEAMASGCPVITSTVSVLPETAGDAAVLCNPAKSKEIGEKISLLLNDEIFRNQIIQKGYERARQFHPEMYGKKLVALYRKIIKERDAKRS